MTIEQRIERNSVTLSGNHLQMSKQEIKTEINKVLDHFSDKALEELLQFLKDLEAKRDSFVFSTGSLEKILSEDKELLAKLAQ